MSTEYVVLTPTGTFTATWQDGEAPVVYAGDLAAIELFRRYMKEQMVTGNGGMVLDADRLEPAELYGFCQSEDFGIVVLPDADDMEAILRAEAMEDE